MKKIILFLTAFCLFSFNASASFYLNPGLSLGMSGDYGSSDIDNYPVLFGVQAGYGMLGLSFGLDYGMSMADIDYEGTRSDDELSELGLFVGYEFPLLLRVWGSYMFDAELETGASKDSGDGLKFGVGYTGLPFLSLNLEFRKYNFDDRNGGTINNDFDMVTIGVSLPLNL